MPNIYVEKHTSPYPWSMPQPHKHEHYEIQFLIKGSRFYFVDDVSYRLQTTSIIVVPPHIEHMTSGSAYVRINLNLMPQALNEFYLSVLNKFVPQYAQQIPEETMQKILPYVEQLLALPQNAKYETYAQCILSYLFFLIDNALSTKPQSEPEHMKAPIMIYRIIDYINANIHDKITLDKIAKNCNCSVSYVRKLFQTYMQRPLYDYILAVRLDAVKKLLTTTTHSITEIAELCGFSSANYLCLIFKKKEGLSPLAYKKLLLP